MYLMECKAWHVKLLIYYIDRGSRLNDCLYLDLDLEGLEGLEGERG